MMFVRSREWAVAGSDVVKTVGRRVNEGGRWPGARLEFGVEGGIASGWALWYMLRYVVD